MQGVPESKQLGEVQTLRLEFNDQAEYYDLAWIERAIPTMEADADRKSYASAAMVPIGKAIAMHATATNLNG